MTAIHTAKGELLIHHRGNQLALRPVTTDNPRELVDRANASLRTSSVTGDDAMAWAMRRKLANVLMTELLDNKHASMV